MTVTLPLPTTLTRQLSRVRALSDDGAARLAWLSAQRAPDATHESLARRLLDVGGHFALIPGLEEDLAILLARGESWPVSPAPKLIRGAPSRCHRNSADLFERRPGQYRIVTGYGLSLDGDGLQLWRQHTWLWDVQAERVTETTVVREAYWGVALTDEESDLFCFYNA